MRLSLTGVLLLTATMLSGCAQLTGKDARTAQGNGAASASSVSGVLSRLRPKADPTMIEKIKEEEALAQQRAQQAQVNLQNQQNSPTFGNGLDGRTLPKVSQELLAPPAEDVAKDAPTFSAAQDPSSGNYNPPIPSNASSPPQVASYGSSYGSSVPPPPPGAMGGSLVPPPPAVTLSTQAAVGAGAIVNPYEQSPYAYFQNPYNMQMPPQAMMAPQRPNGSPFGVPSGHGSSDVDEQKAQSDKKIANFVPITPTGMEPRSAYKQRDDIKVLWKGAISAGALADVMTDGKFAEQVNKVDVGLPGEATKGAFSVSQRQVDTMFRGGGLDKRIVAEVRKVEGDVAQAYYRYLYSYNKFALSEQTLAARKQEVEVAGSPMEQQRAAAEVSQAQNEVDSTRDDMRSAQSDLAALVGPAPARSIIGRVSGVTPSLDSLAQAPAAAQASGGHSFMRAFNPASLFHFGKEKGDNQPAAKAADKDAAKADRHDKDRVAKADSKQATQKSKDMDVKKESTKKQNKDTDRAGDLTPAPTASSDSNDEAATAPTTASSGGGGNGISFELKGVNVSPRKSILTVSIRNNGSNSYSFSPDVFSISEGNHKLSEAAMRADFDQTMVQPNGEVKGTITIFGRPWNDKLAVVLQDGSKTIQLRR